MTDKAIDDRGVSGAKVEDGAVPDEFGDAFDVADQSGEKAELSPADDSENTKDEEVKPSPESAKEEVTSSESDQKVGESDEKYEQRYKTLQGIHKHDRELWEAEKAALLAQVEVAKKPVTPEEKKDVEDKKEAFLDSLTPEQQEQLKEYEQDFDVVSKMEGIKRSIELAKLRKEIDAWKTEIASQLTAQQTQIAPAVELAETNAMEAHLNKIRSAHEDFEKYRDDGSLKAWIESKPKYMQPALQKAYSQGSAEDVIDLYNDFKRENNITETQLSDNVVSIKTAKAAKKQALSSVTTRRGAVNLVTAISDDFEGAFEEALNK